MRFLLAFARALSFTTASVVALALVVTEALLGARLLPVPFLADAVQAGRVFPALLAACGALVVASDWSAHERTGARSVLFLVLLRWVAGAVVAAVAAWLTATSPVVAAGLFGLLGLLASVLPRHWWLALPPLLYLQLYLPPDLLPR
ncbi:MAG: hypothetical protein ACJ72L_19350 [Marmoricola sp.]